ncbi:MAG: YncE family protein [Tenuifilaceae bacterium]|nr:YncE family protein [Tenuifilaceae bacterium]
MQRFLFTLVVLAMVFSCTSRKKSGSDDFGGVLIVSHKTDNTVYFINRETGYTLKVLETGLEPHEVEVSDDGTIAVVCNYGNREVAGNTLSVYDIKAAALLRTIDLGEHTRPHGMQWIAGTQKMLVTAESTNNLLVVDVAKGQVERAIGTEQPVSHMVAANIDFTVAFVPSIRTGYVTVIDLVGDSIIAQVYSGKGAEGAAVSPNGKELWVTNRADNTITVFDTKTFTSIQTLDCGDFPIRIKFTPNGSKVLVSNAQSADVAVFDAFQKTLLAKVKLTVPLPEEVDDERFFAKEFKESSIPIGLVVPHNSSAYVANTNADLISEINLETYEIVRHFPTGKQPDGIGFSPLMPDVN